MAVANQNLTTVKLHPLPPVLSLLLYMLLLHLCLCWFAILESIIRLMNVMVRMCRVEPNVRRVQVWQC